MTRAIAIAPVLLPPCFSLGWLAGAAGSLFFLFLRCWFFFGQVLALVPWHWLVLAYSCCSLRIVAYLQGFHYWFFYQSSDFPIVPILLRVVNSGPLAALPTLEIKRKPSLRA